MKIVVIGDTHIPKRAKNLPELLVSDLKASDLIIHTGDWQPMEVYEEIKSYGNVVGVHGNVDDERLQKLLPEKVMLELEGWKIAVTHGHGKGQTTEKRALAAFNENEVDCVIFGHSHIPLLKKNENVILFNPGSPTDKRRQTHYSYGIITLHNKLDVKHVFFKK